MCTVASPDPDPKGGGQLPNPKECNSTLTSGTRTIYPHRYILMLMGGVTAYVFSERFKTWAAHFPIKRDGRTGIQRATLGKSGSEAASQLQGRIVRAFSSNSFVNTMDMTATIEYILTAAQSLGSQDYYKKSRMTILGLAGVLFCENEQA